MKTAVLCCCDPTSAGSTTRSGTAKTRAKTTLCHLLLVADMVGIEAFLAVEFIMMVANVQTLGVPVVYSSLPGVISAALSGVLMPALGLITEKVATSRCAKAVVLMSVNVLQIVGGLLVFSANALQLLYYGGSGGGGHSDVIINTTTSSSSGNANGTNISSDSSNHNFASEWVEEPSAPHPNLSMAANWSLLQEASAITNRAAVPGVVSSTAYPVSHPGSDLLTSDQIFGSFPVTGLIAIIGYAVIDAGYDISNCFLKTFVTAVTHPDDHSDIIVKSIFVGSFGGCLITVVGSLGIGKWLTEGTSYDANATECAVLAAVSVVVMVISMAVSLVVGLLYKIDEGSDSEADVPPSGEVSVAEERTHLFVDSTKSTDLTKESVDKAWGFSQSSTHTLLEHSIRVSHRSKRLSSNYDTHRRIRTLPPIPQKNRYRDILIRNRHRIFLCLATFLSCGAHYSFNLFSVNFVGVNIFKGDPSAPVDSQEYANYLEGMQAGSVGFILLYVFFVFAALSQSFILRRHGWWIETAILSAIFLAVSLACALSKTKIAYYVTASMNGCYRALVFTVPYIVVERIGKDMQAKGHASMGSRSSDIVMIAFMWPCAFALCSGIMGPLLEWTGDVATPIFYTTTLSGLGAGLFWLVRKF